MDTAVLERRAGYETRRRTQATAPEKKKSYDMDCANERLWDIMKKASDEAKNNGYKPEMLDEILDEILKDDDE
jgi:hypothetical protein